MWWTTAKAGDKVVAVSQATETQSGREPIALEIGKVYTIRKIRVSDWCNCGIALDIGAKVNYKCTLWMGANLFRPITPKSTDKAMKAIREHLKTKGLAE